MNSIARDMRNNKSGPVHRPSLRIVTPVPRIPPLDVPMTVGYARNQMTELNKALRQVPFLQSLEDSQIDYLVKVGQRVQLKAGELLFRKGDPGRCMYVILEGRIQIYMESSDGQAAVLGVLESTQFFGEMALLDGGERSANALAMTPCEFFVLERASFLNLITTYPELLTRLLSGLSERLRRTDERYLSQMAGVAQEVKTPLDAIVANVRGIKQDLEAERVSPLLRPFVNKIWNSADDIEKSSSDVQSLLQKLSSPNEG
jgi:CRP-like cAMP-binding protein